MPAPLAGIARQLSSWGGYEAARTPRTRAAWSTQNPGPNAAMVGATTNLVARSRDLERNDAHWTNALELFANEVVGTGIVPRAVQALDTPAGTQPRRERTAAELAADAAWAWWVRRGVADCEGRHTLYSRTWTAARAWARDGSGFIRRVWDATPGRLVPCGIQLLERDMLDTSRIGPTSTGGRIVNGIQVSATGRVEGYWFFREHPGDQAYGFSYAGISSFVPEADVIHIYTPLRAGQLDGVPLGTAAMARKFAIASFQSAELTRKHTESCIVGVATPPPFVEAMSTPEKEEWGVIPTVIDANGDMVGDLRSGAFLRVENGGNVQFLQPHVVPNYSENVKTDLREVAVGTYTPYSDLTGDLEGVNYTSYRAGHMKRHAHIDAKQALEFIPQVMDRLWDWCQEAAFLVGSVETPDMPRAWSPPKRISVDPEKDLVADIVEERAGYALHADKLAERGGDPATYYEKRAAEKAEQDRWNLVFDSDPSQTGFRGSFASPGGAPPPGGLAAALAAMEPERLAAIERILKLAAPPALGPARSAEPES